MPCSPGALRALIDREPRTRRSLQPLIHGRAARRKCVGADKTLLILCGSADTIRAAAAAFGAPEAAPARLFSHWGGGAGFRRRRKRLCDNVGFLNPRPPLTKLSGRNVVMGDLRASAPRWRFSRSFGQISNKGSRLSRQPLHVRVLHVMTSSWSETRHCFSFLRRQRKKSQNLTRLANFIHILASRCVCVFFIVSLHQFASCPVCKDL